MIDDIWHDTTIMTIYSWERSVSCRECEMPLTFGGFNVPDSVLKHKSLEWIMIFDAQRVTEMTLKWGNKS